MDRHSYYRALGLTCDASQSQIKRAYEERMNKLNSADYADDPEYRRKRKEQITEAYKVLTGNVPVPAINRKKSGLERLKDIANRDDCDTCVDSEDRPSFKERFERNSERKRKDSGRDRRKSSNSTVPKAKGASVAAIIFTIITLITSVFSLIGDILDDTDYTEFYRQQQEIAVEIDYFDSLDASKKTDFKSKVIWNEGEDEYGSSDTYVKTRDVLDVLGVDEADDFFEYMTGDEYFYQDYDDKTCAETLISWLGAPEFKDVAGMKNEFTGDRILDHSDYLNYLEECLWNEM